MRYSRTANAAISRAALSAFVAVAPLFPALLAAQTSPNPTLTYPAAARGTQVDDYHGTSIADPYRWLENVDSPATKAWVEAENRLTDSFLATIPQRTAIRNRLTQLWNYERYSAPFKENDRYFYFQNTGLQNQSVLYVQDGRNSPPRVLLDPNTLSPDGTVALSGTSASHDGRYLAYSLSTSGSDWQELHVRSVDDGRDLPDIVKWVKFSGISWTHDNKGFFYSRYDEPVSGNKMTNANKNQKLYYHRIGQAQSRDELVYDRPDQPDWLFDGSVSDDGQYLVITVSQGTDVRTRLYFVDLDDPDKPEIDNPVVRLIDKLDAEYSFIGNRKTMFYVRTDRNAPRGRIVAISIDNPREERWNTIIPENRDALVSAVMAGDDIVANYLQDAHSSVRFYASNGDDRRDYRDRQRPDQRRSPAIVYDDTSTAPIVARERAQLLGGGFSYRGELRLPAMGTVGSIQGRQGDDELFYTFTSFLYPTTVYRYDLKSGQNATFRAPRVAFDPSPYETRQVFYTSKDGTRIPMYITAKKGIKLDGSNPTLLYAYGGFNISETPSFSAANIAWLEMGGIYALANLRGGGEYGKEWHEAGMLSRKQNVFDDFIAAAEYLINQKYTSTPKLAIRGGSNGGLLIGAVENQRPDLFGATMPEVGVMDMLRFQKFTIGWAWTSDYGSSDDPEQFKYLVAYSPLHNIKPGTCYPPTLAFTADHDDRVVPGHTFKYVATLQAAQSCPNPILVRIETKAGHGAGKPTTKQIDETADRFAFLVKELHMTPALQ
ncbi:MAG TPA: prolyl oligopeptidase family serine peptidase [Gemmatimonadaceae bacterium]|jgi:prolyl oligopeptidase|nr:prolyl oligopeptidase family serine peptidase [Gemmatimonadaceae bacterium]